MVIGFDSVLRCMVPASSNFFKVESSRYSNECALNPVDLSSRKYYRQCATDHVKVILALRYGAKEPAPTDTGSDQKLALLGVDNSNEMKNLMMLKLNKRDAAAGYG